MRTWLAQHLVSGTLVAACVVAGAMTVIAAPPAHAARLMQQGTSTITGIVTDARNKQPIPGASVIVVGTRLGAPTGADGRYRITGVPNGSQTVSARRIGYASLRHPAAAGGDQVVNFELEADRKSVV